MSYDDKAQEDYRWVTLLATGSYAERANIFAEQRKAQTGSRLYFDRKAIEEQTPSDDRPWFSRADPAREV
jgi:hypothetical protein